MVKPWQQLQQRQMAHTSAEAGLPTARCVLAPPQSSVIIIIKLPN
jgi:hypothetical protein